LNFVRYKKSKKSFLQEADLNAFLLTLFWQGRFPAKGHLNLLSTSLLRYKTQEKSRLQNKNYISKKK
jgi:hypothetical protein